jgi:hypothetical protein
MLELIGNLVLALLYVEFVLALKSNLADSPDQQWGTSGQLDWLWDRHPYWSSQVGTTKVESQESSETGSEYHCEHLDLARKKNPSEAYPTSLPLGTFKQ